MAIRLPSRAGSVLAPIVLVAVLAGCGGSSGSSGSSSGNGVAAKPPTEILSTTKAAAHSASSVHVAGSIVSSGSPITIDLELVAGKGGRGRLSEGGLSFELIQSGGTAYIKGSRAFYARVAGPDAAKLFEGKWLKAPASSGAFASLVSLTDLSDLVNTALVSHGTLTKGSVTTVAGQTAIGVTDSATAGTLYVATTGTPYPIAVTKHGKGGGSIGFNRWNEPVSLTPPANAIDITKLQPH